MARPSIPSSLCPTCRLLLHQKRFLTHPRPAAPTPSRALSQKSTPKAPTPKDILSRPTWSTASLLETQNTAAADEDSDEITPKKLHHLLRLSALPLPPTPEAEATLLSAMRSHLRFVRDIQSVNTEGVQPLQALRDESASGKAAATIGLAQLREALDNEVNFGHRKRPKRVAGSSARDVTERIKAAENWEPLKTAGKTMGKFFVVQRRKSGNS